MGSELKMRAASARGPLLGRHGEARKGAWMLYSVKERGQLLGAPILVPQ